jgi:GH15 family glucan-1,4-alpha-glucosidase
MFSGECRPACKAVTVSTDRRLLVLSDCHTGALLAADGSIDWLCVPRFDARSVFGSLLGREGGTFRLAPFGVSVPSARYYEPGTNVMVTTWKIAQGWIQVRDALTLGPTTGEDTITPHTRPPADEDAEHMLVRTVTGLEGDVEIELVCEPTPGGERNWDYRYTWMRDSTFTLQALHLLGLDWEADEFMQFVADLEPNSDGGLQIMYGIDGRRDLTETLREDLSGYSGAKPVRIGNGAFEQRQNDVYGAVLDSIHKHTMHSQRLPRRLWPIVQSQAEGAARVWRQPDQGIWEARGKPRHYVSSKLMCWVAMDRGSRLAEIRGDRELQSSWAATAAEIHADTLEHGVSERGVLRQRYDTDALDASTLLAAIFGFLPGDDERLHNTVVAIANELSENGFVLRYKTEETDDGLSGKEGTFLICSFWLASALSIVGEAQRGHDLMERLLRVASPPGLYAEEYDAETGRHLGNFPQEFSHLALIECSARIILTEQLALEGMGPPSSGALARSVPTKR